MECHGISGITGLKALLRESVGLCLFMGLRPTREHAITHRDVCSLSSLNERDTLDISMS